MESNWQYVSIDSDNGLVLNWRQAIIWTNADPIHWRIYVPLGGDELTYKQLEMHGAYVSTAATNVLVQKHQAISINSADLIFIALD